jgi:hypothetical protein
MTTLPNINGLFDNSKEWQWAPTRVCQREGFFPNMLAYSEAQATLALIIKRSTTGDEFALSKVGLDYQETAEKEGARGDGKPVRHALIVLVDPDQHAKNLQHIQLVSASTVQRTRERIEELGLPLRNGNWGQYYWITPEYTAGFVPDDEWSLPRREAK